mmetsp:Transcript_8598/g.15249  ORF Transcript_8598/g.15249 Transcript_8598/m.15249 type:complete len:295 (+) Transcript_8598:872-1756(+)
MCRVLASENYKFLALEPLHQPRNLHGEGHLVHGWFMNSALDEACSPVLTTKVYQNGLFLAQKAVHNIRIQVLDIFYCRHRLWQVRRDVLGFCSCLRWLRRHRHSCDRSCWLRNHGCRRLGFRRSRCLRLGSVIQHESSAKRHCCFVCGNRGIPACSLLNWQAQRLPAPKASRENGYTLPRICLGTIPVGTLRRSMGRILTGENYQRLLRPLLDKVWHLRYEGYLVYGRHMNGSLNEPGCAILPSDIDKKCFPFSDKLLNDSRVQVFNILHSGHSIGSIWWHILTDAALKGGTGR